MNAAELLTNSLSGDHATRSSATQQLEEAAKSNYHGYVHTLTQEIANEQGDANIRVAAGLALKNSVQSRDAIYQPALTERWLSLPEEATTPLKQSLLSTLGTQNRQVGNVVAQCVSAIAMVELPAQRWQDLMSNLLNFAQDQSNIQLRVSTLVTLGFICEVMDPEILAARSNEILTAVVQGARKEETSMAVQGAAITALYNSLEFIRDNFDREGERNYIMQVVCEATQSQSEDVQIGAYQCLVRIMSLYYEKMAFYMERALFGLTLNGMQSPNENVALQAIEFWSTVCDEEIDLMSEAAEAASYGETPALEPLGFARDALAQILPTLLELLTQQEEDEDEEDWTKSMAAAACLELLAQNVGDPVVPTVVQFVEGNIRSQQWQQREAAVMAFGAVLEGPDATVLGPLVNQALSALIQMLSADPSVAVQDTVAWTLSKITEAVLEVIDPNVHLQAMVSSLVEGLNKTPRISNSCCSALGNLVTQLSGGGLGEDTPESSLMSPFYPEILTSLMRLSDKPTNDNNSRSAAYQTISAFCSSASKDRFQVVHEVAMEMINRQERYLAAQNQLVGADDRQNWNNVQSSICTVIQAAVHRTPQSLLPLSDRIMTNLANIIQSPNRGAGVVEDAFSVVGELAGSLESGFVKYIEPFSGFLFASLEALDDSHVTQAGVYLVSDISRSVNEALAPYAERLLQLVVNILRSPVVSRDVKPSAITAIGEIAMAIGSGFVPYLGLIMEILSQAGATSAQSNDIAMVEFVWTMRESIVDAFIGIMNGLKIGDPTPFLQYVPGIAGFLRTCMSEEERTDQFATATLGLIGDFGETYKAQVRDVLMEEWVQSAIAYGRQRGASKQCRRNASYAQKAIRELSAPGQTYFAGGA